MIMKKYYSSNELDESIKKSILKNAKELAIEIKNEKVENNKNLYV